MENPGRVNFCPGELILELLARIGEWHQNLSEKTVLSIEKHLSCSLQWFIRSLQTVPFEQSMVGRGLIQELFRRFLDT